MEVAIPTLRVVPSMRLRKTRRMSVDGDVLVDPGERVGANDIVARASVRDEALRVNLVEALGLSAPDEAARYLVKSPGDAVRAGEEIGRKKGVFGKGGKVCLSPIDGTIASGPTISGEVLIAPHPHEIELEALLPGEVVGILPRRGVIVEGIGSYIQCLTGIGNETQGIIKVPVSSPSQTLQEDLIDDGCGGGILIAGSVTIPAIRAALMVGVRGIIVGSISAETFLWLQNNPQPVTLVITEGFGSIPMAKGAYELCSASAGQYACIFTPAESNSVITPSEVFIPTTRNTLNSTSSVATIRAGATVRIVSSSLLGSQARVLDLPTRTHLLASGIRSDVVKLRLEDGRELVVGRSNVELID